MISPLKSLLLTALFLAAPLVSAGMIEVPTPTCTDGAVFPASPQCTQECNVSRPGGDITRQRVANLEECATLCSNNPQCVTAQFRKDNSFCYLKRTLNRAVANTNVDGIVCQCQTQLVCPVAS